MLKKSKWLAMLFIMLFNGAYAQDAEIAKFKAMFTLNFIRYIGWPEESKQGDFVIGVLNEKQVLSNLQAQTVGKKFGFQNIVVKEFKSVDEVAGCQILFYSNNQNFGKNAAAVMAKLKGSALIITEVDGAIADGSMINFVIRDEKLKFELSSGNAEKSGLKFSSSLTSLSNAIIK